MSKTQRAWARLRSILVAASCILTSGLRLNVSTSLVDDEGVDLVFHRRGKSTTLAVQVKSRSMATKGISQRGRFYAQVKGATFRPRRNLYLLFVPVNTEEPSLSFGWCRARRLPNGLSASVAAPSSAPPRRTGPKTSGASTAWTGLTLPINPGGDQEARSEVVRPRLGSSQGPFAARRCFDDLLDSVWIDEDDGQARSRVADDSGPGERSLGVDENRVWRVTPAALEGRPEALEG